ncbi:MAG: hypothetical protein HYY18_23470 [Planctomycetes bacterium]|nr:hypothetical protein [Planctomycetota bacterium]
MTEDPKPEGKADASVHYSYLGLALLLYGVLAAWSFYHVRELIRVLEFRKGELPVISKPLFLVIDRLGPMVFVPMAVFVLVELFSPRNPKLTRVYLAATLLLVLGGIYVGVALYLPAKGLATP